MSKQEVSAQVAAFRKWKRRRELLRIVQQIKALPQAFYGRITAWRLEKSRAEWLRPIKGAVPASAKIAVFLIYQPTGLAESVLHTCRHLVAEGYAPLVVSNGPMSSADADRIAQSSWVYIERPNFGYDFGGYQEGVRYLFDHDTEVDRLVLLNDSIWYPLFSNDTTLRDLEARGCDATGALILESTDHNSAQARRRPFLGSFLISFNRKVVEASAFRSFWSSYRPTNNKYQTIRQGERSLSYSLLDSGHSICALLDHRALAGVVDLTPPNRLNELLKGLVTIDPIKIEALQKLLDNPSTSSEWWHEAIALTKQITAGGNIASSAPILCVGQLNTNWLKKSRDWHNLEALKRIRSGITSGEIRIPEECILSEIDATLERSAISIYG